MRSVAILALLVTVVHAEPAKRGGKKPPAPPDAAAQLEAQGYAKFRVRMQATCTTSPNAGAQAEQITAHASLEVVQYGGNTYTVLPSGRSNTPRSSAKVRSAGPIPLK